MSNLLLLFFLHNPSVQGGSDWANSPLRQILIPIKNCTEIVGFQR